MNEGDEWTKGEMYNLSPPSFNHHPLHPIPSSFIHFPISLFIFLLLYHSRRRPSIIFTFALLRRFWGTWRWAILKILALWGPPTVSNIVWNFQSICTSRLRPRAFLIFGYLADGWVLLSEQGRIQGSISRGGVGRSGKPHETDLWLICDLKQTRLKKLHN